ncbi:MAG: hypothetical protein HC898_05250 [Phycisphaerales bacterium]|nr:hypothetical protein [Phycisphaerales bacterium]
MVYIKLFAMSIFMAIAPTIAWRTKPKVVTPGEADAHRTIFVWRWGWPCVTGIRLTGRQYQDARQRWRNNTDDGCCERVRNCPGINNDPHHAIHHESGGVHHSWRVRR